MSVRNLEFLFKPRSVAVVGASNRPGRVGSTIMKNLLGGGFEGPVLPVNPKHRAVTGVLAYSELAALPVAPELVVLCTPPRVVPEVLHQAGRCGAKAAIILTSIVSTEEKSSEVLKTEIGEAAREHELRILGPNCLGLISTESSLNASFAHVAAAPGSIAFVSQSGALCTAVLDWAQANRIGFSHFVSVGDMSDVDFGDLLDYLSADPGTSAILLYIESIKDARKFMSAARAAARNKRVVVIKSGRVKEGAQAAATHTGALAGSDDVYNAAIRRAGMLRVYEIDELFAAVETLAKARPFRHDHLTILTNGGGPGVMATDALIKSGGSLSELSPDTLKRLDSVLPPTWSRSNPVDIIGDAPPERYGAALKVLQEAPEVESILLLHVPTAISSSAATARAVVEVASESPTNLLTNWLGSASVDEARSICAQAGIPTHETPEQAVRAFFQTVEYQRNQKSLMEVPPTTPRELVPARETARLIIQGVLADGRELLNEAEAKAVLAAYGIPVVKTSIASGPEDAPPMARELGYPVALKILSPDISHKSDVGGVALDLETPEELLEAMNAMKLRVAAIQPDARVTGFSVQKMARRPGAHELIVGTSTDPVFGPVLLFGQGGTAVDVIGDRSLALPPLNMNLARAMVSRTRVSRLLGGYRDRPAANREAIYLTLTQVSQLVADISEVTQVDINPLLADSEGVLALDARMVVKPTALRGTERLAIRPYPSELEEKLTLRSGEEVLVRPIRPEDEPAHHAFLSRLTAEDIRSRFFGLVREMPHTEMARYTQIDYDREMALIATTEVDGKTETLGVVRAVSQPDGKAAEFAIVVRSDYKRQGLGKALMTKIIDYCRRKEIPTLVGQVSSENAAMLGLVERLGFERRHLPAEGAIDEIRLSL